MEGGGSLLLHQANLRRVRYGKEVRQHGKGDGRQGVHLQQIHGDGVGIRINSVEVVSDHRFVQQTRIAFLVNAE